MLLVRLKSTKIKGPGFYGKEMHLKKVVLFPKLCRTNSKMSHLFKATSTREKKHAFFQIAEFFRKHRIFFFRKIACFFSCVDEALGSVHKRRPQVGPGGGGSRMCVRL